MPRKTSSKKLPRHAIFTVRQMLGLTQSKFGDAIGASFHTIQAIEGGHLPLSHRFACAITDTTGISTSQLMRNELKPLPDPAKIRSRFQRRDGLGLSYQDSRGKKVRHESPHYLARLSPRYFLLQTYLLARAITDELEPVGCRNLGFYDLLRATIPKLFECIPNPRIRKRVRQEVAELIGGGPSKVLPAVAGDVQELIRVVQKKEKDDASDWAELVSAMRTAAEWKPPGSVSPSVQHSGA